MEWVVRRRISPILNTDFERLVMPRPFKMNTTLIFLTLLTVSTLSVLFQNCSGVASFTSAKTEKASGGNGDGYQGKPTIYDYYSLIAPCTEVGASGAPLPNEEFFVYSSLKAKKVRSSCQDISPQPVTESEITFSSDRSTLTYNQNTFTRRPPTSDFAVVAAGCPAGMTTIPGAVRTNIFLDSQDLNGPSWSYHPGVASLLDGTIAGLPRYSVYRATAPYGSYWYRPSQLYRLRPGTKYAYTFVAERQTNDVARVFIWQYQAANIVAELNLATGVPVIETADGVGNFSIQVRPLGKGYATTIYFDATSTEIADFGVASFGAAQGDSIYTTAFQLEEVVSFCR